MQRLFSTFPNEWPGAGLLLLRLMLATSLVADALSRLHEPAISQILTALGEILTGPLLALGLWTPVAGSLACLLALGMVPTSDGATELYLIRANVGLCLVLLGPGAWSLDARLFGRRRVEIKHLRDI